MNWDDLKWISHWLLVAPLGWLWVKVNKIENDLQLTKAVEAATEQRFKNLEQGLEDVKKGVDYLVKRELEKSK